MSKHHQRINGFEQIKAFYSWVFDNQDKNINASHISLYLFLINQNNRVNWVEWFKCPYDLGMTGSGIGSRNTYYKCLDDLKSWSLIDYKKGVNNYKAPKVKIYVLKNEQQVVPLSEQVLVPLSEQQVVPLSEPLTEHIYKLLTNNLKLITDNIEGVIDFLKTKGARSRESGIPFKDFWEIYQPMRKGSNKKTSESKWKKLSLAEQELAMKHAPVYLASVKEEKYRKLAETYLNQKHWEGWSNENPRPQNELNKKQKLIF